MTLSKPSQSIQNIIFCLEAWQVRKSFESRQNYCLRLLIMYFKVAILEQYCYISFFSQNWVSKLFLSMNLNIFIEIDIIWLTRPKLKIYGRTQSNIFLKRVKRHTLWSLLCIKSIQEHPSWYFLQHWIVFQSFWLK